MIRIIKHNASIIIKNCLSFLKIYSMFLKINLILCIIPFKYHNIYLVYT